MSNLICPLEFFATVFKNLFNFPIFLSGAGDQKHIKTANLFHLNLGK